MDNELETTINAEIENTYNYYKSLGIFEDSNCNTIRTNVPLTIETLKEHYKIKLDDKNKNTNTNIYCYKQDIYSNNNKNINNNNILYENSIFQHINNTSKNSILLLFIFLLLLLYISCL